MQNDVYSKEYWEKQASTDDGYFAILSQEQYRNPENFWKASDGLTSEVMNSLTKQTTFLDLGCGYSRIARHIKPLIRAYTGIDFSVEMIKKAKEFHKGQNSVWFFNNNGVDFNFITDESFSIVYSCLLFQHLPRTVIFSYIFESIRTLKPNGKLFIYNIPKATIAKNGVTKEELEINGAQLLNLEVREDKHYFHLIGENA